MNTFPFGRSQIDQHQRRQGDQADAQYRRVRLDPTPNGPRCGSESCAEVPWRPPPFDGGGLAKGGDVTLYYDGTAVGTGRVGASQPMIFSADETTDIGYESGTTVTPDYTVGSSRFTGKINWVQIDLGKDDHDHFIDPDERLRIAMARQ
jgi:hypothetical protein